VAFTFVFLSPVVTSVIRKNFFDLVEFSPEVTQFLLFTFWVTFCQTLDLQRLKGLAWEVP
jgi:F420-0:gamma-glutamyl ligase-like protein